MGVEALLPAASGVALPADIPGMLIRGQVVASTGSFAPGAGRVAVFGSAVSAGAIAHEMLRARLLAASISEHLSTIVLVAPAISRDVVEDLSRDFGTDVISVGLPDHSFSSFTAIAEGLGTKVFDAKYDVDTCPVDGVAWEDGGVSLFSAKCNSRSVIRAWRANSEDSESNARELTAHFRRTRSVLDFGCLGAMTAVAEAFTLASARCTQLAAGPQRQAAATLLKTIRARLASADPEMPSRAAILAVRNAVQGVACAVSDTAVAPIPESGKQDPIVGIPDDDVERDRILDVLINGPLRVAEVMTLAATIKLIGSLVDGQFQKPFEINPSDGPVSFVLDAVGFQLTSATKVLREVPAASDAEPATFILRVLDAPVRRLTLSLFQRDALLTQLVIDKFGLETVSRQQNLGRVKETDLSITVMADDSMIAHSPKNCVGVSGKTLGRLVRPSATLLDKFRVEMKKLYMKSEASEVERDLKLHGLELAECLPQDLLEYLGSGKVDSMLIQHPRDLDFPFELVTLQIDGREEILGDVIRICRWLSDVDNSPATSTKAVRNAAFLRGFEQDPAPGELAVLRSICASDEFSDDRETRRAVFQSQRFDLVHFFGHCNKGADGGVFMQLQNGRIRIADVGKLQADKAFAKAEPVVFLNACGTSALEAGMAGNDSFPHRFLENRANLFLGTLWPIAEEVAHEFSSRFYDKLRSGVSASEALRSSKSEVAAAGKTDEDRIRIAISLRGYSLYAHPEFGISFHAA